MGLDSSLINVEQLTPEQLQKEVQTPCLQEVRTSAVVGPTDRGASASQWAPFCPFCPWVCTWVCVKKGRPWTDLLEEGTLRHNDKLNMKSPWRPTVALQGLR